MARWNRAGGGGEEISWYADTGALGDCVSESMWMLECGCEGGQLEKVMIV